MAMLLTNTAQVWSRLKELRGQRQKAGRRDVLVGVLGCMAERLKDELLDQESLVNFIAGPDAYRGVPLRACVQACSERNARV